MKTELRPYPAYKTAESEWLEKLPIGWSAIQLARLNTKLTNGFVGPTRDILQEEGVRYLQSLHIKGGRILFDTPYFVSEEWSAAHKKSVLKTGDVLIVQTGDIGQVAAVTDDFAGCNCHALIIVCAKPRMIDGFFLSAVLRSHYGFHSLKKVQTGALHPHLNCTYIRDICLPVPPLAEQRQILAFLDQETAKIDRLMEVRRKQVERLQEQRITVIHHAVTKGLDPNAKLKSSGLPWTESCPTHWELIRLKFLSEITLGKMITNKDEGGMDLRPYLKARNVRWEAVEASDLDEMWFTPAEMKSLRLRRDDLVVSEGGEVGRTAIWREEAEECYLQNSVHKVTVRLQHDPEYLLYQFFTIGHAGHFDAIVNRISIAHLTREKLADVAFLVPPKDEQKAIVSYIKRETAKLDTLTAKYGSELELLAEYRASLISHAVTGRIDVRGLISSAAGESR